MTEQAHSTITNIATLAAIVAVCTVWWRCAVDEDAAIVACIEAGGAPVDCREGLR